jgi:hypothetical protein
MPSTNPEPVACLMSEFDAREWSGVTVFARGANVVLPTYAAAGTTGLYADPLWFLNGRMRTGDSLSVGQALGSMLTKAGAAAAGRTFTTGIDADDRVFVQADGAFDINAASASNALGFSTSPLTASAIGGGLYRATAQADWSRGAVTLSATAGPHLDVDDGTGTFDTTTYSGRFSNVVEWLRTTAANDADEPATLAAVLEYLDNDANGVAVGTLASITWGIDDSGHVFTSWPSSTGIAAPTWSSTTFRDRLGFSGNESAVTTDGLTVLTADYPMPGVFVTVEPLQLPPRDAPTEDSSTLALVGGGMASTLWRRVRQWDASFYVEGPASVLAQHRHYVDRFLPYVTRGRPITLYPEWGDPRRRLDPMSVTASVDAYGLLYTSQEHGERGRIIGTVSDANPAQRVMEWQADRIRTRVLQSWTIEEGR